MFKIPYQSLLNFYSFKHIFFLKKYSMKQILPRFFSTSKHLMELENKYGCHNYAPLPVVIDRA